MPPEIIAKQVHERRPPATHERDAVDISDAPNVTSLRLHVICVVLTLLAAFIFTLTEHDDHEHTFWCMFEIAVQSALVIVATVYFRMRLNLLHQSTVLIPVLVMIACLSLLCEPVQRLVFGSGHPFEMLIMHTQCNLMLALAVCGFRISFQRLAVVIAVFLTMFCCTISSAPGLLALMILFSITAITWLIVSWWETVDRRLLRSERNALPRWSLTAALALPIIALMTVGAFGANTVTTALTGFLPSSGGTGEYSPYSRGGVKDGDALIAGNENIRSFAPLNEAPFLDSDKPSLYDVFNETFDEPEKQIKDQQRAVALPADVLEHVHQMMAEAKQAGREFSLLRSEKQNDGRRIRDLDTHALFYVAGRTPLHLKSEVYELFDGVEWTASTGDLVRETAFRETGERHWLNVPQAGKGFDIFDGTATHSLKIANLGGNIIPSPAHAIGVSIDRVNRIDMYHVYDDGRISLNRKSIPTMTPISFVSRCVNRSYLSGNSAMPIIPKNRVRGLHDICISLPEQAEISRIRSHATRIAQPHQRGWQQIAAIERYLRDNYVVDRTQNVSADSDSPVAEFLFKSKRGPEYLFASAAAIMLRTQGYSTRLVGGFYASPENYDEHKRHTAVFADDAHFWCEVLIGAGTWITIEPSPGYELLSPPPGFIDQLLNLLRSAAAFVTQHAAALLTLLATIVIVFASRRSLQNTLLTLRWRMISASALNSRAIQLATLIDHRLRLAGLERRSGTTLRRWARQTPLEPVSAELRRVADIADRATFASAGHCNCDLAELNQLANELSFRQLKQLKKEARHPTEEILSV